MLKVGLLCGVIAAMSATGVKANLSSNEFISKECNTRFIVELNDEIENISEDRAINEQNALYKQIKRSVNANSELTQHYSFLNNAMVITGNKDDIDAIRNLSNVKSVIEDGQHIVEKSLGGSVSVELKRDGGNSGEIDLSANASAITMNKPDNTNDGEGTLVAVLDNEFYFRGKCADFPDGYMHETFAPLDSSVNKKITNSSYPSSMHATKLSKFVPDGSEGSLWFNSKVPFYYDYAGDSTNGSSNGVPSDNNGYPTGDYNVRSEVDLHGSHVASIAAGNAPSVEQGGTGYKGIAPKAQLACMKVFSDIYPTSVSEEVGNPKYSRFSDIGFLNALEDAVKLKADIINVSIGSDLNDFDMNSITMRTLTKLSEDGYLTSISNGNGGKSSYAFAGAYGNWTKDMVETGVMGSFANNKDVMSIAAGQPVWTYYEHSMLINGETIAYDDQIVNRDTDTSAGYATEHRLADLSKDGDELVDRDIGYIYVGGFGDESSYKGKEEDVPGKVVVVNRGSINFSAKYVNAANYGAIGLIIINNDPTATGFTFRCDFGDEIPEFPCEIVLFKDKKFFEANPQGTFKIKEKTSAINKFARTVSDYSSDGATFDLDLKPEITTPGSNIKGAVWPQNKEERLPENEFCSYEYFDGTSMAAPNYEGAMSVVLSKVSKDLAAGGVSTAEEKEINAFRKTINMRFMSTANPMTDYDANDEDGKNTITSPRMQGAGMADIKGAYNTDVFLEGKDFSKEVPENLNKSKILLRNNEDIAKGDIKLGFVAHSEAKTERKYQVSMNVMRPAIAKNNDILTGEYNDRGVVENVKNIPGFNYYSPEKETMVVAEGSAEKMDAIKVTKDLSYYENAEQYAANDPKGVVSQGYYSYDPSATNGIGGSKWVELADKDYLSVKDVEIANLENIQEVTVAAHSGKTGYTDTEITINPYSLTKEVKDKIASLYPYGTYIEGYVTLKAEGDYEDLSIPYMGYYSLTDRDANASYDNGPVVEPFDFEKDSSTVYASDLVNDITKSLLGKDNVDFASMWMAGYLENPELINTDSILTNDENFGTLKGFYPVGTKPDISGSTYTDNPKNNIYVGNAHTSNTMVIQQFVMRSVKDNYFTITNKANGVEVYRSALEDMLFGQADDGNYSLYKSHVSANYLGGGYVAHRAYAIVPLYDAVSGKAFDSGEYEVKFNYLLSGTGNWVSNAYTMHIDSEAPLIKSIEQLRNNGKETVRINFEDEKLAYAVIGKTKVDVSLDSKTGSYYAKIDKSFFEESMEHSKTSCSNDRLFISAVDYARGTTNAIAHFSGDNYSNFEILEGYNLSKNNDFKYENGKLKVIAIDAITGAESEVHYDESLKLVTGESIISESKKGCGGSIITSSSVVTVVALLGVALLILKKKKYLGGK